MGTALMHGTEVIETEKRKGGWDRARAWRQVRVY